MNHYHVMLLSMICMVINIVANYCESLHFPNSTRMVIGAFSLVLAIVLASLSGNMEGWDSAKRLLRKDEKKCQ